MDDASLEELIASLSSESHADNSGTRFGHGKEAETVEHTGAESAKKIGDQLCLDAAVDARSQGG